MEINYFWCYINIKIKKKLEIYGEDEEIEFIKELCMKYIYIMKDYFIDRQIFFIFYVYFYVSYIYIYLYLYILIIYNYRNIQKLIYK